MFPTNSKCIEVDPAVYKNFAQRMRRLLFAVLHVPNSNMGRQLLYDCRAVMQDWENAHKPVATDMGLPDWAESLNTQRQLVLRAQLCTKDGRRVGNARIIDITDQLVADPGTTYYRIRTDVGHEFWYTSGEVHEAYWVGDYIMKEGE